MDFGKSIMVDLETGDPYIDTEGNIILATRIILESKSEHRMGNIRHICKGTA